MRQHRPVTKAATCNDLIAEQTRWVETWVQMQQVLATDAAERHTTTIPEDNKQIATGWQQQIMDSDV